MRKLEGLLNPRSIALIGASKNFNKLNGRPLKFLLNKGYAGDIFPVNPSYEAIGNLACYPDVASIPTPVDLAVIAVPAGKVAEALRQVARKGVPAAIVFSSGFSETGEDGAAMERELREIARDGGVALCGPNTLGLINSFEHVMATFSQFANGDTPAGPVGFVTQSGAFGTAIAALARQRGLGLGYFVNTGNEAGVGFAEVMSNVLADERIRLGAGYIEGLSDGAEFVDLAERAMALDTPLIVTKVGRTGAGARAAASHTGSLAGEDAVFDGVCAQYGVIRANDEEYMLDVVEGFVTGVRPAGGRVGLITQSGGAGVLMADRAVELGLEVARLNPDTIERLRGIVPSFGAVGNPVDITAQFIAEPEIFCESVKAVLSDPDVDFGIVWFQLMHEFVDTIEAVFSDIRRAVRKPLLVCWVAGPGAGIGALRAMGFPVFRSASAALNAASELVRYTQYREAWALEREAPAGPPAATAPELPRGRIVPTIEARDVLARCGVAAVETALCASPEAVAHAARRIGFPVVLKIESPQIAHKSDVGGVHLGIRNEYEAERAAHDLLRSVAERCPDAELRGVLVQAMDTSDAVELVIGLKHDTVFGLVIMLGMGGVTLEVCPDVVFRRVPVSRTRALAMLDALRGAPLLGPVRGRPAIDRQAVADLVSAVSRFGAANAHVVQELDINPIRATADGARAVDWLLVTRDDVERPGC